MTTLPSLFPFQRQAVDYLRQAGRRHLLTISATGSGKSRIFIEKYLQTPRCRMILTAPLIALLRQHEAKLKAIGIPTFAHFSDRKEIPKGPGVWLVCPEKLGDAGSGFRPELDLWLENWPPDILVLDECHTLWEWGDGFRPTLKLWFQLLQNHRTLSSLWLTATLPWEWQEDWQDKLKGLGDLNIQGHFSLPKNLEIEKCRLPPYRKLEWLEVRLNQSPKNKDGLIFAMTRDQARRLAEHLRTRGILARSYHAGMSSEERSGVEGWLSDDDPDRRPRWVVSTSAFGLGIEFPRLYQVILWQPPPGLLSLAQFAGRVGRANNKGIAIFLWHPEDFRTLDWLVTAGGERARLELDQVRDFYAVPVGRALEILEMRFNRIEAGTNIQTGK